MTLSITWHDIIVLLWVSLVSPGSWHASCKTPGMLYSFTSAQARVDVKTKLVWQKPTWHCRVIFLQLKNKSKTNKQKTQEGEKKNPWTYGVQRTSRLMNMWWSWEDSELWEGMEILYSYPSLLCVSLPSGCSWVVSFYVLSHWLWLCIDCVSDCDSIDCSPPSFSIHGILQARILTWVAILFSRVSSWPRDGSCVS